MPLESYEVPLNGFSMHLRRSELESVAAGLGEFDSSEEGDLLTLAEALRRLPPRDRAPTWELALRRYGHHRPLVQAAGELGLDEVRARELLSRFTHVLAEVPAPERVGAIPDPETQMEESPVTRVMSGEILGNAVAHGDSVDLEAAHEASLRTVEQLRADEPSA